jgi:outer membrane protein assembly factor BamB
MRNLVIILTLIFSCQSLVAQITNEDISGANESYVSLYFLIKQNNNQPVEGVDIELTSIQLKKTVRATTNSQGRAQLMVLANNDYSFSFDGFKQQGTISTRDGKKIKTFTFGYTPGTVKLSSETTNGTDQDNGSADAILIVTYKDETGKKYPNVPCRLIDRKTLKLLSTTSNSVGEATFKVMPGHKYKLSVESVDSFKFFEFPKDGGTLHYTVQYAPTIITEAKLRDTIWQSASTGPTTSRVFVQVNLKDYEGNPLPDEVIAFVADDDNKVVYAAKTNNQGIGVILLPKKRKYMLHLKYERNIDLLTMKDGPELHNTEIEISYHGSKNLEAYFAQVQRDQNGFRQDFLPGKLTENGAYKPLITKTAYGYAIHFEEKGSSASPLLYNGVLFTGGGYYNKNLTAIEHTTGKVKWNVELAEGGASPAVMEDGVLLVNTESCTLYAVDAASGKLLWSKWLSYYVRSTPTIYKGKVYVTYPNQLSVNGSNDKYVIGCFDLKTGKVAWQQYVDAEALGSVVAFDNKVYMTSFEGTLYSFNSLSGGDIKRAFVKSATAPTLSNSKIYIGIMQGNLAKEVKIQALNKDYLTLENTFLNPVFNIESQVTDPYESMSASNGRILAIGDKLFTIGSGKLVSLNANGSKRWELPLHETDFNTYSLAPAYVAGKLIVPANTGIIYIVDPLSGKVLKSFSTDAKDLKQPVISDGWIFSGSGSGKIVAINTGDKTLTGWGMWGGNAAHNMGVN